MVEGNYIMTFKVGDVVSVDLYHDKGPGKVLNIQQIFNTIYLEIFFEQTKDVLQIAAEQAKMLVDPFSRLASGQSDPVPAFLRKYIVGLMEELMTTRGVISAGNFRITPLPHQIMAVDFVLSQFKPRCLIADEVGLGKTIEGAMIFEELKLRGIAKRILIITPSGLAIQWQEEMKQKFNEDFIVMDRNLLHSLKEIHGTESNAWLKYNQVITSIDFIKPREVNPSLGDKENTRRLTHQKDVFQMAVDGNWDVVIFDEAHKLSKAEDGSETARYKVGKAFSERTPVFLLLTATPHQGEQGKFFHLMNMVDPEVFTSFDDIKSDKVKEYIVRNKKRAVVDHQGNRLFKQRVTTVYPVDRNGPGDRCEQDLYDRVTKYVSENYNTAMGKNDRAFGFLMILFQRLVSSSSRAIFLALSRRLEKLSVIKQTLTLQSKQEIFNNNGSFDEEEARDQDAQTVLDDLDKVSGVYSEAGLVQEISVLEELVSLAQLAARGRQDSKARELLNIVDEVCRRENNPQTKFLIFTEFVATQESLAEIFQACGYEVVLLNGRMSSEDKVKARDAFREKAQFLISTDAGGEGINLQFCHVMVNYDLPWNPMKIEQRIGRLDRIGQKYDVMVFNLIIGDTVEERVREILETKLDLIRDQFGEDKLSDVLTTLPDEFSFDKLFIDAVVKRKQDAQELETVAQHIYESAKQILAQGDLLLPQSTFAEQNYQEKLLEVSADKIKCLVENELCLRGQTLHEYAKRKGIYYFDIDSNTGVDHYQDVVFSRDKAIDKDSLDYFHINHSFVKEIIERISKNQVEGTVGHLQVPATNSSWLRQRGVWAVYRLRITNNSDFNKVRMISVYVDEFGVSDKKMAHFLASQKLDGVKEVYFQPEIDIKQLQKVIDLDAQSVAGDLFSEEVLNWTETLQKDRIRMDNYFNEQQKAIDKIAIANIRDGKQKELERGRKVRIEQLKLRGNLVPKMEIVQLATVMCG